MEPAGLGTGPSVAPPMRGHWSEHRWPDKEHRDSETAPAGRQTADAQKHRGCSTAFNWSHSLPSRDTPAPQSLDYILQRTQKVHQWRGYIQTIFYLSYRYAVCHRLSACHFERKSTHPNRCLVRSSAQTSRNGQLYFQTLLRASAVGCSKPIKKPGRTTLLF